MYFYEIILYTDFRCEIHIRGNVGDRGAVGGGGDGGAEGCRRWESLDGRAGTFDRLASGRPCLFR